MAGSYPIDQGELELLPDADISSRWLLRVNGTAQSFVDVEDPTYLEFDYIRQLAVCIDVLTQPGPLRAVHLGGGGATLPRWVEATRPGSRQLVLERDAALVDVVRQQLGLPRAPAIRVRVGDARELLLAIATDHAELVVHDIFAGGSTPAHVTSTEFFSDVRRVLDDGGHLLANIADGAGLAFARSQVSTLFSVWPHVVVLAPARVMGSRRFGNLILIAGDAPLPVTALRLALTSEPMPVRVLDEAGTLRFAAGAPVVTDATAVGSPPIPA
jgi:spermidine synthase